MRVFARIQGRRRRVPRWLAIVSGVLGSLIGLATNLYSDEFRRALDLSRREIVPGVLPVVLAAVVASVSAVLCYAVLSRHRGHGAVVAGEIAIGSDFLGADTAQSDSVVGRSLHYLEARRAAPELVVFLPGLGLDAEDFHAYMGDSRYHCRALTLYGFHESERSDEHFTPIALDTHVRLLRYALGKIHRADPGKRITLVGFSVGADLILFLADRYPELFGSLPIAKVVLLDPNVNSFTTTISSRIARVDGEHTLRQLADVLTSAETTSEFRYLCEYLAKITMKDFAQIRRCATEIVDRWPGDQPDRFLNHLSHLTQAVREVRVVLSFTNDLLFNQVSRAAATRGLDSDILECSMSDHFELIQPDRLKERLEGLV